MRRSPSKWGSIGATDRAGPDRERRPLSGEAGRRHPHPATGRRKRILGLPWGERSRVAAVAPRPLGWDDIGMAINSRTGRTQDQMHIHVDCLDARLKRALAGAKLSTQGWSTLNLKPWAGRYHAKRLAENGLERNVFQTVAKEIPGARTRMGLQKIAVAGVANGKRGFVLLEKGAGGSAEELLDHECRAERR
jgi:CDP-diacylglycerol pyrophosphatase